MLPFTAPALVATIAPQSSAGAWTRLSLDAFPAEARQDIGAARDAALATPTRAEAVGRLAILLHAWEQFEPAALVYAEARRLAPNDVTWWALSGTLANRVGRPDQAVDYFARANAISPSPFLTLRHADALLESGRIDDARVVYEKAAAIPEAEPAARYGLGRVSVAAGDGVRARREFERAVALVEQFGAAHYALAQIYRQAGDLAAARDAIARQQRCLACWPMPPDPFSAQVALARSDAAALLQRGVTAAQRADAAQAIALHEQALARGENVAARLNLIALYAQTNNLAAAETQYRKVLASGNDLADAHHAFGLALLDARDPARAEPILREAVAANPHDARAFNGLGFICETSGRLPEAETAYRQAVAAQPANRAMRFALARVLVNLGRLDEALVQLTQLREPDDAESARYVFAAGAIQVRMGNIQEGRRLSEEALQRARKYNLTDLVASIERDMAKLK
ncbi:MAG TPA: tetratricopeptide repeat protein [Luteitalea sp.]|nr:tetratricopeptide repeat protein [Luteitalea sp.]